MGRGGRFLMSLIVLFLALAVRTGSARFEISTKVLGVIFGLGFSVFLLEHLMGRAASNFDTPLFRLLILQADTVIPGIDSCVVKPARQAGLFDSITGPTGWKKSKLWSNFL
jgi:hypothetical protein